MKAHFNRIKSGDTFCLLPTIYVMPKHPEVLKGFGVGVKIGWSLFEVIFYSGPAPGDC